MKTKLLTCKECGEYFRAYEEVVQVRNDYYHKSCVTLYPTNYCAFIGDEYLGETENGDGELVFNWLDEGEYVDLEEGEV